MPTVTSPLSSMSYTNKDFRDIYPELLDLVKKLTYKWDPSISNESDPGVILLKLNAIIGDKNNYNIDKNVLEVFPETLTQQVSARSMYHQLAYEMPWYKSATTTLTFKWKGRELQIGELVKIPKYTMVCDSDSKFIYTLTQDVSFTTERVTTTATAMQGVITDVTVNGDTQIHLVNLDHNNRLYLDDYSVAENGIFITNVGENTEWTRKSNLAVESRGNMYYEFGVDGRNNQCYIEFPDDIETLIRDGLEIKYILSDGTEGNVAAKQITAFYDDTTVTLGQETITLSEDNCILYNFSAAVDGSNPQEISDAYKSYKKISGTFDTLVTLRDYINAIYRMEYSSNNVVSDRNNDLQSSYTVISDAAGFGSSLTFVENKEDGTPEMSAFDLKMYLLHNPGDVKDLSTYESTFKMIPSQDTITQKIKLSIKQQKSIVHDFKDIIEGCPCLFRIAYPLRIKIVPQYKLTDMQQTDVKKNVMLALFKAVNSHQVEFGTEPSYDEIYDIIANADERIKLAIIDDFTYTTYATFWTGTDFRNIPLCNFDNDPYITYVPKPYSQALSQFQFTVQNTTNPQRMYFICNGYLDSQGKDVASPNSIFTYDITKKEFVKYAVTQEVDNFRKQIIAKSVMAGVTPLFNQEAVFEYSIDQQIKDQLKDVERVTTYSNISPFGYEYDNTQKKFVPKTYDKNNNSAQYTLKDNESIQFLAPSFVSKRNFSNYVTYQFVKKTPSKEDEYVSLSWDDFNALPNPYDIYQHIFTEDADFSYAEITQLLKDKRPYYVPVFEPNKYYSPNGSLIDTYPQDEQNAWGKGTFYTDSTLKHKVEFVVNDTNNKGLTFNEAWQQNLLGAFWQTSVFVIPANTDYKLQPGDSLVVFYTEEDAARAPYTYEKYVGTNDSNSPIIRVSFTLNGLRYGEKYINPDALGDTGYIPYNSAENSAYNLVYTLNTKYSLSGTQSIDIRGINETPITKDTSYYYFITNNINDDNEYIMNLITNGKYAEYTLKTDEYFIYTNNDKTEFEILGPATLVRFESDKDIELKVDVVDYNEIANQGISSFESACKLFQYNAILREQQIYNFTGNDIIRIDIDTDNYNKNTYPYFETDKETVVENFTISYSTDGSVFNTLPNIDLKDEESNWKGTAILNIDSSFDDPQVINNKPTEISNTQTLRQSIQQLQVGNNKYPIINNVQDIEQLIYFLTNVSLTRTGGENVDVTYVSAEGERKNLEMLVYGKNPAFNNQNGYDYYDNKVCLKTQTAGAHIANNISLQNGFKYLLGINNNANKVTFNISITTKTGTKNLLQPLNNTNSSLGSEHLWYFILSGDDLSDLKLNVTTEGTDDNGMLVFDDLVKYQDNDLFLDRYNISVNDILAFIKNYDSHTQFKYNYIVDEATKIEDPVVGKSFFSEKHIFNNYAIPEALLKPPVDRTLQNESIISIINNR